MVLHQNISPLSQTHRIETVYGGGRLMEEGRIEEVSTSRADEIGWRKKKYAGEVTKNIWFEVNMEKKCFFIFLKQSR